MRADKEISNLAPLGDKIIVEPDAQEEVLASGLVIPGNAQEKPQTGTVIAVGEGKLTVKGVREPSSLIEGDRVLFSKFGGTEITQDGKDRIILRDIDILCKIEGEKDSIPA